MVFRKLYLFIFSALVCASSVCVNAASQEEKAQLLADACLETMNVPAVNQAFKVLATKKDWRSANKAHNLFYCNFHRIASTLSLKERMKFENFFFTPETLDLLNRAAQAKNFQMFARILIKNAAESLDVTLDAQVEAQMTTKLTEKMGTQDYAPLFDRQLSSVKKDVPKKDVPKKDVPKKDVPKKDVPKKDVPKNDAPKNDVPKRDLPKKEALEKEVPKKDDSKNDINNDINKNNIPLWRSTFVMGITSGISLGGYFLVLNERWKKEVEAGTTKLSRAAYISKAFFSASLNDWTTYLKFFAVGTAGVAIYNQVTK